MIKYRKHLAFGVKLTSDGYGGFIEVARAQSVGKGLLFQLDISERKHPKEYKQQSDYIYDIASPADLWQIELFLPGQTGGATAIPVWEQGNKNGVSITGNVGGGLILGLLRPYMVEVDKNGQRTFIKYSPADSLLFTDYSYIYGGPSFGKGWSQMTVTPGFMSNQAFVSTMAVTMNS